MASSPSVQRCLPLTHRSFTCATDIRIHDLESDGDMSNARLKITRGHALLRRQVSKSIFLQPQKPYRRRFTFSGIQDTKILCKKRRRFTSVALPTKFLLGGNINDPLNLRSLEDEKINKQLNALTPASSPVPIPRERSQVQVLIPPNIYDPLNLNTGEEIEFNLLTSKHRKRRRHRKNRRDDAESGLEVSTSKAEPPGESSVIENSCVSNLSDECTENDSELDIQTDDRSVTDKIVSPVVPQGSPAKFFKRYHSRSFSKDAEEKSSVKPIAKRRRSKTRLQQHADSIRFRANAQKFCYGNHIVKWGSDENIDQRLHILSKDLFYAKDVLDIGCNSGELTLFIAKDLEPRKIIGVDIDKKLINIAQRKIRTFKSEVISENADFPESLATLYGSLAKVGGVLSLNSENFPDNVSFFEANYVPGCEEYLDTQKPEFDVILCLRVTKWIHLNFGDEGLKMAFKRMFAQLRNGGHLILEPQPWFTYSTSKRITPSIFKTYCELKMRPEMFCEFLLSEEVGFSSCELIGRTYNSTKVYRQPIYLLTKGFQTPCRRNIQMDVLPTIPFHSDQWNNNSDEQGTCRMWSDTEFLSSYSNFNHPDMQQQKFVLN